MARKQSLAKTVERPVEIVGGDVSNAGACIIVLLYMLVVLVVSLGVLIELYKDMLVLRGVLNLYEQLFSSFFLYV